MLRKTYKERIEEKELPEKEWIQCGICKEITDDEEDAEDFPEGSASEILLFGHDLVGVELRADITVDGLSNGNLGGRTSVEDFIATMVSAAMPGAEDTIRSVVEAAADLTPSSDPTVCEELSAGYSFEAVPPSGTPERSRPRRDR